MFNFFVNDDKFYNDYYVIDGNDFNHIKNVLRMKLGEKIIISCNGKSSLCEISEFFDCSVKCKIINHSFNDTSLPVKIYLFQGLPKNEKMELIIQKCVELGVFEIYPVEMEHCVVKLDDKRKESKQERWQKIAESAAKQSKCNMIPTINNVITYKKALEKAANMDIILLPYENKNGMEATKASLSKIKKECSIGIFIGPEGGFSKDEIELAIDHKADIVSLGKRILRTETAAITAVGMCMLYAEMNI